MPEPGTTAVTGAITNALTAIKDIQLWLLTAIALFLVACLFVPVLSAAVPQEGAKVCHSRGRCIHHPCRVPPRKSCYLSDQQVSRRPGGATDISPDANNQTILVVSHSAE